MKELTPRQVLIIDPFWSPRLETNARAAIFHQWCMLEKSLCIDNFRIAAGLKEGFREGWFFADSDAYKWLDAAARIQAVWPSDELECLMDDLIALLARAQMEDGYIYTYNQLHFPGERWGNLMIEHELYCHGHLIEAGVSHFEATGKETALSLARKAGDLLVRDFLRAGPSRTSGHEEIELALLRLYQTTGHTPYLDLAKAFLERRGRVWPFALLVLAQNGRVEKRKQEIKRQRKAYLAVHPEHAGFQLPPDNDYKAPKNSRLRWILSALSGKYFQMHAPIRKQTIPVGHSVRFGYLETAMAMLARLSGDASLLPAMEKAWERMITRRMYVTGGLGALPGLEGFGRDEELDPEYAYAETCAALSSLFWNWELTLLTANARYADLFEWQLYNAAAVGMGLDGDDYLYNNPLISRGGVIRRPWFACPCCPSNLSRTWASLGKYIYSFDERNIWINQYIGSRLTDTGPVKDMPACPAKLTMISHLPWEGTVRITVEPGTSAEFTLHLRIPSWAGQFTLRINGKTDGTVQARLDLSKDQLYSGYDPRQSWFLPVKRRWEAGDVVELQFDAPVVLCRASPRLPGHSGQLVLTRGPLVYCLESIDNPDIDIFSVQIQPQAPRIEYAPDLLGGIRILRGETVDGRTYTAIPYHLWGNRGESQMTVWINTTT